MQTLKLAGGIQPMAVLPLPLFAGCTHKRLMVIEICKFKQALGKYLYLLYNYTHAADLSVANLKTHSAPWCDTYTDCASVIIPGDLD